MLEECGFQVIQASNPFLALQILRADPAIDLLLTDVVMPGSMSGFRLAEQARRVRPDLPVLFTSGYVRPTMQDGAPAREIILPKPFTIDELRGRVTAALENGTATILIVDDDEGVLELLTAALEEVGYNILLATSASEALEILMSEVEIDLLLTDIVMPGETGGFALARIARARRADLRVVYISGKVNELPANEPSEHDRLIAKPWQAGELRDCIKQVLTAH